jgi:hypothetical protein
MTVILLRVELHIIVIFNSHSYMTINDGHMIYIHIKQPTWATPLEVGEDTNVQHLQAHVLVQRSHMSEHASARFGFVDARAVQLGVGHIFSFTGQ